MSAHCITALNAEIVKRLKIKYPEVLVRYFDCPASCMTMFALQIYVKEQQKFLQDEFYITNDCNNLRCMDYNISMLESSIENMLDKCFNIKYPPLPVNNPVPIGKLTERILK